ncbi:MAG: PAS domain S-box protein [Hyphomicrobiales bacterium]|nr:MAG: PAS domain S-box protein [Hyphomicrobiales bacterium]
MDRLPDEGQRGEPANILLVDDTPAKLLTYEVVLAELGEQLLPATSVNEALAILLKEDVALILTDVSMPGTDGFSFATMVREHPRFRNIPIIFVSAIADTEPDKLKGYASGAVDYVTAPINPELLRAKIRVFMELYRKQRELQALRKDLEQRVAMRTAELEQSARRLALSEERYRTLVESANDIVATFDLDMCLTSVNPAIALLGYRPEDLMGRSLADFIPPDQFAIHQDMLARKLNGDTSTRYEMELLAKDKQRRFILEVSSKLMTDDDGRPLGIHAIARDVTQRKESEVQKEVLIHELQHRTKNLLAVVQSIVVNTLSRSSDCQVAREAIMGRLHALARAQEFVASGPISGVPIRELINAELSGFTQQVAARGKDFVVGGGFAQQLALVIHELATNASKYGSLSCPEGYLSIDWDVDTSTTPPSLCFSWREFGGPPSENPGREGFGTQLIAAIIRDATRSFTDDGIEFIARIPVPDLLQKTPTETHPSFTEAYAQKVVMNPEAEASNRMLSMK